MTGKLGCVRAKNRIRAVAELFFNHACVLMPHRKRSTQSVYQEVAANNLRQMRTLGSCSCHPAQVPYPKTTAGASIEQRVSIQFCGAPAKTPPPRHPAQANMLHLCHKAYLHPQYPLQSRVGTPIYAIQISNTPFLRYSLAHSGCMRELDGRSRSLWHPL